MIYIYIYFSYTTTKMFVFTWLGLSLSVPSALCNTVTGVSKRTFRLYPRVSMMEPVRIGLTEVSVVPRGHAETALCFTAPREADHTSPGTLQQESWPHPSQESWPHPLPQERENWPRWHGHRRADSVPFPEASVPLEWPVQLTLRSTVGTWVVLP